MIRLLKFLVWTGCAVGLGVYLSTVEYGGKTPVEHAGTTWKRNVPSWTFDDLKARVTALFRDDERPSGPASKPKEHHSSEDKDALNRLISKKAENKG